MPDDVTPLAHELTRTDAGVPTQPDAGDGIASNRYLRLRDEQGRYADQWDPERVPALLEALSSGRSLLQACEDTGINRHTLYWRMRRADDEAMELAQAIQHAKNVEGADAIDDVVSRVVSGTLERPSPHPAYVAMAYKRRGLLLDRAPAGDAGDVSLASRGERTLAAIHERRTTVERTIVYANERSDAPMVTDGRAARNAQAATDA